MLQKIIPVPSKAEILDMTTKHLLIRQLKDYGLDPNEWQFDSLKLELTNHMGHAELFHRRDKNLRLRGTVISIKNRFAKSLFWQWHDLAWDI
ncbi:MAG: hypothetical protein KDD34_02335 [Bdellovibrionales bacterium]|nr:hypothetical protein [Bdellovibrionales bacterium]